LGAFAEVANDARDVDSQLPLPDAIRAQVVDAWAQAWSSPADASVLQPVALADEAGLNVETVGAVLDLFTVDLGERTPLEVIEDFLRGDSPLRARPIVRNVAGDRVIVHDGLLLPAIRERIEEELKRAGLADRYSKRRGEHLESAALALLTPHLPGAVVHKAFEYFVPDPDALVPQTDPATFSKLVEGDGLLLVDDVAVIVEAKAGALTDPSRTGQSPRLRRDVAKIVTAAANQAARLRERIAEDCGLRLRDGSWLDLGQVREIHAIAVSLEDLTGIVTVTADLVNAGLLPGSHIPWTVSLHDLRVISEVVARPAEFLLYLRRRTEPNVTRKFLAIDELDLFLHMYATGLYVEPDPDEVARELPQFPPASVADRRRHARQPTEILTSRTDDLDAWYFHRLGLRSTPTPQPKLNANPELLQLVDTLAAQYAPGWLSIGTTLLEGSSKLQRQWAAQGPTLSKQTARDGREHTCTVVGGHRADMSFLLVWASLAPGRPRRDAKRHLRDYLAAKKHQMQAARGAVLMFDATGRFVSMLFNNTRPGHAPTLDAAVVRLGLRSIDDMTHRPPPKPKPRRKR
jgi:hypothetical protein